MAGNSEELPKHLRHINKFDNETQSVVRKLKGDQPEDAPRRRTSAGISPLDENIQFFFARLEEPYCRYTDNAKHNLKSRIIAKKKRNPEEVEEILAEENKKLDSAEEAEKQKKKERADKLRKNSYTARPLTLLEKIYFWWYKRRNTEIFDGGRLNIAVLEHFDFYLREKYKTIADVCTAISDRLFSSEFFNEKDPVCSNTAYNLIRLFSREMMGLALSNITRTETVPADISDKINELTDFIKIFIVLNISHDRKVQIIKALKELQNRVSPQNNLSEIAKKLVNITPQHIEALINQLEPFFDAVPRENQTLPKILACFSCLFGRAALLEDVTGYLNIDVSVPPQKKLLTSQAAKNLSKILSALNEQKKQLEIRLERVRDVYACNEFASAVLSYFCGQMPLKDQNTYSDDPFMYFSKHINDFLLYYEDFLNGKKKLQLLELPESPLALFETYYEDNQRVLSEFPIKQEILGKIKRHYKQDPQVFRSAIFDKGSESFKMFPKLIQYVMQVNGTHAYRLYREFDREIERIKKDNFDVLIYKITDTEIVKFLKTAFSKGEMVKDSQNRLVPSLLFSMDKFKRPKTYEPDSLFAFLSAGKALTAGIAYELHETGIFSEISEKEKLEAKLVSAEESLRLFTDPAADTRGKS